MEKQVIYGSFLRHSHDIISDEKAFLDYLDYLNTDKKGTTYWTKKLWKKDSSNILGYGDFIIFVYDNYIYAKATIEKQESIDEKNDQKPSNPFKNEIFYLGRLEMYNKVSFDDLKKATGIVISSFRDIKKLDPTKEIPAILNYLNKNVTP